jgi:hypothetical protein
VPFNVTLDRAFAAEITSSLTNGSSETVLAAFRNMDPPSAVFQLLAIASVVTATANKVYLLSEALTKKVVSPF